MIAQTDRLLDARGVGEILGLSTRSIWKQHVVGRLPPPVRIGRSVRWSQAELVAWIRNGCPPRDRWAALWRQMNEGSQ